MFWHLKAKENNLIHPTDLASPKSYTPTVHTRYRIHLQGFQNKSLTTGVPPPT